MADTNSTPSASGIYAIRNKTNSKMYVGSAVNIRQRWAEHRRLLALGTNKCAKLQAAWSKYGGEAFEFIVLESVADKSALLVREQHWIDSLNVVSEGYNLNPTAGSMFGSRHSEERKAKMSALMAGRKHTPEARAKMSAAQERRRKVTREDIEKLAAVNRGQPLSPEHRKKIGDALAGKPLSPDQRERVAKMNLGRKHSEETRAKVAEARKRQIIAPHSAETRAKLSELAKAQWKKRREAREANNTQTVTVAEGD